MNLEAVSSGDMSSKKALKSVFHGPAGGFFSQRKKASLENIKHSGDEKDIFLKSGSGASVYSDVESLSDDDENVNMSGGFDGSLLNLAVNTSRTKRVNTGANFSSPIGSPDFEIDEKVKLLLPFLRKKVPLNKIWIDLKIIKTLVEILEISYAKNSVHQKNFSKINGFGGATTPSKFEGIIRSTFTSEESMKKAILLAGKNVISVNNNLRKQEFHSNQAIVIKKILMDMPRDMIVTTVSEFGQIKSIKIQLIRMWQKTMMEFAKLNQTNLLASKWLFLIGKNSVYVAKAAEDHDIWALRDQFRALLFTLPVRITAHNLGTLLEKTGKKTCIINYLLETGNRFCCAVINFESDEELESVFFTEPIFGEVHFLWARLNLVQCGKLVSLVFFSGGSPSGSGLLSGSMSLSFGSSGLQIDGLGDRLAVLEHSLEIFSDQVSVILKKLSFVDLVPLASTSHAPSMTGSVSLALVVDLDMALDDMLALSVPSLSGSDESAAGLSSSGFKVLTSKVGGLESKLSALKALFGSILARLDFLCSGSGSSLLLSSQ
ncbi:hypothetical protein G9A89_012137 [Geosiphon pyriformis]|nr:hypothetical protein G9A89_012137 [Geosiphon pyriformis]